MSIYHFNITKEDIKVFPIFVTEDNIFAAIKKVQEIFKGFAMIFVDIGDWEE